MLMRLAIPRRWWPPILWMAFVLVMTSWPQLDLSPLSNGGDKVAHFGAYAVMGLLTRRALGTSTGPVRPVLVVVATIAVLGLLDELHQAWIPGRSTELADWIADTSGGLVGSLVAPLLLTAARARRDPAP